MKEHKGLNYINDNGLEVGKLYDTLIVKIERNGDLTLNTGGWLTRHTKTCMNTILGDRGRVFQKAGEFFFESSGGSIVPFNEDGQVFFAGSFFSGGAT